MIFKKRRYFLPFIRWTGDTDDYGLNFSVSQTAGHLRGRGMHPHREQQSPVNNKECQRQRRPLSAAAATKAAQNITRTKATCKHQNCACIIPTVRPPLNARHVRVKIRKRTLNIWSLPPLAGDGGLSTHSKAKTDSREAAKVRRSKAQPYLPVAFSCLRVNHFPPLQRSVPPSSAARLRQGASAGAATCPRTRRKTEKLVCCPQFLSRRRWPPRKNLAQIPESY